MTCKANIEAIRAAARRERQEYENSTLAALFESLGNVSPRRVRRWPAPGTATPEDVIRIRETEGREYELIEGTLVEKEGEAGRAAGPNAV